MPDYHISPEYSSLNVNPQLTRADKIALFDKAAKDSAKRGIEDIQRYALLSGLPVTIADKSGLVQADLLVSCKPAFVVDLVLQLPADAWFDVYYNESSHDSSVSDNLHAVLLAGETVLRSVHVPFSGTPTHGLNMAPAACSPPESPMGQVELLSVPNSNFALPDHPGKQFKVTGVQFLWILRGTGKKSLVLCVGSTGCAEELGRPVNLVEVGIDPSQFPQGIQQQAVRIIYAQAVEPVSP